MDTFLRQKLVVSLDQVSQSVRPLKGILIEAFTKIKLKNRYIYRLQSNLETFDPDN